MAWRPVSLNSSQESIVPKTARSAPSTLRSSHSIFVAGEVGVEDQPGPLAHQRLVAGLAQLVAARGGAAVLPDQRAVDRLAGRRVPGDDRLALVGDPDRRPARAPWIPASAIASIATRRRHLPDLAGVVLDPAGPREVLLELRVGAPRDPPLGVEDEAGRARRPLVDREDQGRGPADQREQAAATPEASSPPVPSRRRPIPYISATIVRAWRSGSGTLERLERRAATPS